MESRYERHPRPQFNQPLQREGLKIFHACREPLTAREVAERTGLPLAVVTERLGVLLEQGVLSVSGATPAQPAPVPAQTAAEPARDPEADRLEALKRALVGTLEPKLGRSSADLEALRVAENVAALEGTARRLIVKLKLTVDRKTGVAFEQQVADLFGAA